MSSEVEQDGGEEGTQSSRSVLEGNLRTSTFEAQRINVQLKSLYEKIELRVKEKREMMSSLMMSLEEWESSQNLITEIQEYLSPMSVLPTLLERKCLLIGCTRNYVGPQSFGFVSVIDSGALQINPQFKRSPEFFFKLVSDLSPGENSFSLQSQHNEKHLALERRGKGTVKGKRLPAPLVFRKKIETSTSLFFTKGELNISPSSSSSYTPSCPSPPNSPLAPALSPPLSPKHSPRTKKVSVTASLSSLPPSPSHQHKFRHDLITKTSTSPVLSYRSPSPPSSPSISISKKRGVVPGYLYLGKTNLVEYFPLGKGKGEEEEGRRRVTKGKIGNEEDEAEENRLRLFICPIGLLRQILGPYCVRFEDKQGRRPRRHQLGPIGSCSSSCSFSHTSDASSFSSSTPMSFASFSSSSSSFSSSNPVLKDDLKTRKAKRRVSVRRLHRIPSAGKDRSMLGSPTPPSPRNTTSFSTSGPSDFWEPTSITTSTLGGTADCSIIDDVGRVDEREEELDVDTILKNMRMIGEGCLLIDQNTRTRDKEREFDGDFEENGDLEVEDDNTIGFLNFVDVEKLPPHLQPTKIGGYEFTEEMNDVVESPKKKTKKRTLTELRKFTKRDK